MKTTWRYTVLKRGGGYFVAEEYSDQGGVYTEKSGHTSDVCPMGSSPEALLDELKMMVKDISKSIDEDRIIEEQDDGFF